MLAVFQIAGKQFRGEKGDVLVVPNLNKEKGDKVEFNEILMLTENDDVTVGNPFIENASIEVEVLGNGKDDKIRIYKYKRRTKYRLTQGHRQDFTEIKINKIKKAAKKQKSEE